VFVSPSQADTVFSEGVLTFVDNSVDTSTGTVLLKGEFPEPRTTPYGRASF